jgi:gluconokinase
MESTPSPAPGRIAVVVMGVSGSGKSTVAAGMAAAMGVQFIDGDALHLPQSVAKMKAGIALEDEDRWQWLDRIGARLADTGQSPKGVVVACSALKRVYRDRIRRAAPGVRFVFLEGPAALIESRLAARSGHFMPGTLLASQLQTLELPGPDEGDVLRVGIGAPAADIVRGAVMALRRPAG